MPIPYGQPTDLSILLPALAARIVAVAGLPAERVLVTLENEKDLVETEAISDVLVTIAPAKFDLDEGIWQGGGDTNLPGNVEVVYYNRYEVEYTHADLLALTDANNGILINWRLIMKALQGFVPADTNGNGLVSEPIRLGGFDFPKRKKTTPMLQIRSRWRVEFMQDLS